MQIDIFQVDAFTDNVFGGNPAAVCPLDSWLDDDLLQQIAAENHLSETAFFIPLPNNHYHLRWFTPEIEMDLCGHATLASAYVLFEELGHIGEEIFFESQSGTLGVKKFNQFYELNFPSRPPIPSTLPKIIAEGMNIQPVEVWKARDYLLVYKNEVDILNIQPDERIIHQINIDPGGIIVTAEGASNDVDFVSRLFTPQSSIFEDPVTGSAHCTLIPFWAERMDQTSFRALQLSQRRGELFCTLDGDRVKIQGNAVLYLRGKINI